MWMYEWACESVSVCEVCECVYLKQRSIGGFATAWRTHQRGHFTFKRMRERRKMRERESQWVRQTERERERVPYWDAPICLQWIFKDHGLCWQSRSSNHGQPFLWPQEALEHSRNGVVTILLTVNAMKLFESACGKVIECGKEWRDYLIDCLFDHTLGDKKIILLLNLTRSQGCLDAAHAVSLAKNKSTQHGNVEFVGQSVSHVRREIRRVSTKLTGSFWHCLKQSDATTSFPQIWHFHVVQTCF